MSDQIKMDGVSQDQMIAQNMVQMQQSQIPFDDGEEEVISEQEIYEKLSEPFPQEALTEDSSRGFPLTSIKPQYIIERLNKVLGVMNWTFGGEYEEKDNGVIFKGALVITVNGKQNRQFAPGFAPNKKNLGDTFKGAHTDSLSKCASKYGIGNEVFKGLIDPKSLGKKTATTNTTESKSKRGFNRRSKG